MKKIVLKKKVDSIEKLAILMHEGFEQMDQRFERIDERFEQIDQRFEQIDLRFKHVENRFDTQDTQLAHISAELGDIRRRVERLEVQGASNTGFAKEIDHLISRINELEKKVAKITK